MYITETIQRLKQSGLLDHTAEPIKTGDPAFEDRGVIVVPNCGGPQIPHFSVYESMSFDGDLLQERYCYGQRWDCRFTDENNTQSKIPLSPTLVRNDGRRMSVFLQTRTVTCYSLNASVTTQQLEAGFKEKSS